METGCKRLVGVSRKGTSALILFCETWINWHIFLIRFTRVCQRSCYHMISPQESKSKKNEVCNRKYPFLSNVDLDPGRNFLKLIIGNTPWECRIYDIAQFKKYDPGAHCGSEYFIMYCKFTRMQKKWLFGIWDFVFQDKKHLYLF